MVSSTQVIGCQPTPSDREVGRRSAPQNAYCKRVADPHGIGFRCVCVIPASLTKQELPSHVAAPLGTFPGRYAMFPDRPGKAKPPLCRGTSLLRPRRIQGVELARTSAAVALACWPSRTRPGKATGTWLGPVPHRVPATQLSPGPVRPRRDSEVWRPPPGSAASPAGGHVMDPNRRWFRPAGRLMAVLSLHSTSVFHVESESTVCDGLGAAA